MLADRELADRAAGLDAFERALKQRVEDGTDPLEQEAALQTLRLTIPLRRQLERWVTGRASRAAITT